MGSTLTFAAAVIQGREPDLILAPPPSPVDGSPPTLTASLLLFSSSPKLTPALEHPLQSQENSTSPFPAARTTSTTSSSKTSLSSSTSTTSIDQGPQTECPPNPRETEPGPENQALEENETSTEAKAMSKSPSAQSLGGTPKKICRICWDGSGELVGTGCQCLDSFLHTECLLKWVEVNKRKEKVVCEICLGRYHGPFDVVLNEKLMAGVRRKLVALEREREFSAARTLSSHPRMSKAVIAMAACLVIFAVVLITTFMLTQKKDGNGQPGG